jgi:Co/Zn/Cd efflux system component
MDSTNTTKYVLIGTAGLFVSVAALWLLSRDGEQDAMLNFNPKVHTLEKLRDLYKDVFVEGATLYCQKLNLIRKLKDTNQFGE